jgi:3-dehydroquinate synthase
MLSRQGRSRIVARSSRKIQYSESHGNNSGPPSIVDRSGVASGKDSETDCAKDIIMQTVTVALGERSYAIHIGRAVLDEVGKVLGELSLTKKALLVTQPAIAAAYGGRVLQSLRSQGFVAETFEVLDAEEAKGLEWLERIYDRAIELRLDRRSPIIALGGGVVGDLAGFAAATYMRGVPFIQIPTTLLAQVDSSIGGKTAINHARGKNMIGAFYQPRAVLIDVGTLQTLSGRELRSGLGEVVKYGVIAKPELFELLEGCTAEGLLQDAALLTRVIRDCCQIKAEVVSADEHETGIRAILNFGHTFGHAIEAAGGFSTYTHGEAVAIGMVWATDLSQRMGLCQPELLVRVKQLLQSLGLPIALTAHIDGIQDRLLLDKKAVAGRMRFIVVEGLGQVSMRDDVPSQLVEEVITAGLRAHSLSKEEVPIHAT